MIQFKYKIGDIVWLIERTECVQDEIETLSYNPNFGKTYRFKGMAGRKEQHVYKCLEDALEEMYRQEPRIAWYDKKDEMMIYLRVNCGRL